MTDDELERMLDRSSGYDYKMLWGYVEKLIAEVRRLRKELNNALRDRREAQEDYARRCSRDAFLDGANWLEHRLRDKPLSAYYTRMAWEEACKRWGEEGRDANG
jgi:hypothetical protein